MKTKIELCEKCGKYEGVCRCPPEPRLALARGSEKCVAPKKRYGRPARIAECGLPAFYIWNPRKRPEVKQPMCKECGEMTAGNFTDELTLISPNESNSTTSGR